MGSGEWGVDAPRERRGAREHHDARLDEELLDDRTVRLGEARVVDADAERERVAQRGVLDAREQRLELTHRHVDELLVALVRGAIGDQVERGEARLPAARDERECQVHASGGAWGGS